MTRTAELLESARRDLFPNYRPPDFVLDRGEGVRVWDLDGREYLDLIAGIATCGLGHCHPRLTAAVREQAARLWHTSNLFWTEPAIRLAARLVGTCFADRVFFCNSGAEANEGAIKLARRWQHDRGSSRRTIVAFEQSFHGRTLAALAATGQPKYHVGFDPMPAGFVHIPFGDHAALEAAVDDSTAAVLLEPIQGEAGVLPPPEGFLGRVRELTSERGALMILDEVQSGMGRTGRMWAHQWDGVEPDIMTSAKGLGSGFPIGALLARDEVAAAFVPGTHASTFGGNPLAATAALTTLEVLVDEGVLERGAQVAEHLWSRLRAEVVGQSGVLDIRGRGMWVGLVAPGRARTLLSAARDAGVLVNAIGEDVIRLAPALTLTVEEADEAVSRLAAAFSDVR